MSIEKIKLVIILLLSCSIIATSQDTQFTDLESLPDARSALTSANDGAHIYIVNGFGSSEPFTDEVFQYNIAQDTWTTLTSSTLPKRFASAAIVGDYLYIFNGRTADGAINTAVEKVSLADGSVQLLSENPLPSRVGGVATWENKIYSFGGTIAPYQMPYQYANKLLEFDPENDTWTELTAIPFAGETKGEIVNGKLYIIGGYNGTVSNQIAVYNLAQNSWEASVEMPIGISAHTTAVVGTKIYIVGDFINLTSLAYFETVDNSFQILTSNLNERRHAAAEGIGTSLFAIGGNTASTLGSSISSVQKTDIVTSNRELSNSELINVYPNPSYNRLNVNIKFDRLSIYGAQGKEIKRFSSEGELDISELQTGIYFIKAYKGQKVFHAKFLKNYLN